MTRTNYKIDGVNYVRVNKAGAKKAFNEGKTIYMLPCKACPRSYWFTFYPVNKNAVDGASFETVVNNFEFYNCTPQTGKYTAFYIAS